MCGEQHPRLKFPGPIANPHFLFSLEAAASSPNGPHAALTRSKNGCGVIQLELPTTPASAWAVLQRAPFRRLGARAYFPAKPETVSRMPALVSLWDAALRFPEEIAAPARRAKLAGHHLTLAAEPANSPVSASRNRQPMSLTSTITSRAGVKRLALYHAPP